MSQPLIELKELTNTLISAKPPSCMLWTVLH